jgi:hypothetical protein
VEAVQQERDADQLARLEGMREPEKGRAGGEPGRQLIAASQVEADLAADRQRQHQPADADHHQAGEHAAAEIEQV